MQWDNVKRAGVFVLLLFLLLVSSGCMTARYTAIAMVDNIGPVRTQQKYRLAGYSGSYIHEGVEHTREYKLDGLRSQIEYTFPEVFASDGIPFVIHEGLKKNHKHSDSLFFTALLYLCSAFTFPIVAEETYNTDFSIRLLDNENTNASARMRFEEGSAVSCFSPLALFFWHGTPDTGGYRGYFNTVCQKPASVHQEKKLAANRIGIGYAIAVKLKQLEDAGKIRAPAPAPVVENPPPRKRRRSVTQEIEP